MLYIRKQSPNFNFVRRSLYSKYTYKERILTCCILNCSGFRESSLKISQISMDRIPGLDIVNPEVFGNFSPIPNNIGNIRSEKNFTYTSEDKIKAKALLSLANCCDIENSKDVSLVIYKETQDPDDELTDILHEIEIISDLDHDNVLKFYEVISGKTLTEVALVFEPHASLLSNIIEEKIENVYKPAVIKTIMRDLFTALSYLHQNRIIHRDIQPENITISSAGVLKVWNFRNALKFGQKPRSLNVNEFRYQPLELIFQCGKYDETVDIWSAICIFAQLWLKKSLFPDNRRENVILAVCFFLGFPTKEIWEEFCSFREVQDLHILRRYKHNVLDLHFKKHCGSKVSPVAMDLMHKCFRYDPKLRLKAELCLLHPYFSENPEACPVEEIVTLLEDASICDRLRKMKDERKI